MTEEAKYCSEVMKKYFNKEFVMIKEVMMILKTLLNIGFVIILILKMMLK